MGSCGENARKDKELKELELKRKLEEEEAERLRKESDVQRQKALEGAALQASMLNQQQDLVGTAKENSPYEFDEESDGLLAEIISKAMVEEVVTRASLCDKQERAVEKEATEVFDVESDKLLEEDINVTGRANLGQDHFRQVPVPPEPPDPVVEADIRSRRVVQQFLSWR